MLSPGRNAKQDATERELLQPEFSVLMNWDMAPDGKRFVIVGRGGTAPDEATPSPAGFERSRVESTVPEIRVVVDWFEELRRGP